MIKKITFLLTALISLLLASGCSQNRRHPVQAQAQAHHQSQPSARQSARQHSQNKRYRPQLRRQTHTRTRKNHPTPRQSTSQRQVSRHVQKSSRIKVQTRPRIANSANNANHNNKRVASTTRPAHYSHARNRILSIAKNTLGTRYKYGGTNPRSGFDCSGLMSYIHQQGLGLNIPRTAAAQRDNSRTINYAQLQPGDMLFFKTGKRSNHSGIYIGNRRFIHASTSKRRVMVAKMDSKYWHSRFVKFGTFF